MRWLGEKSPLLFPVIWISRTWSMTCCMTARSTTLPGQQIKVENADLILEEAFSIFAPMHCFLSPFLYHATESLSLLSIPVDHLPEGWALLGWGAEWPERWVWIGLIRERNGGQRRHRWPGVSPLNEESAFQLESQGCLQSPHHKHGPFCLETATEFLLFLQPGFVLG